MHLLRSNVSGKQDLKLHRYDQDLLPFLFVESGQVFNIVTGQKPYL